MDSKLCYLQIGEVCLKEQGSSGCSGAFWGGVFVALAVRAFEVGVSLNADTYRSTVAVFGAVLK